MGSGGVARVEGGASETSREGIWAGDVTGTAQGDNVLEGNQGGGRAQGGGGLRSSTCSVMFQSLAAMQPVQVAGMKGEEAARAG